MKCLIDLDGVLVDFVDGACRIHGRENPYKQGPCTEYDLNKTWGITAEEFWSPMGQEYWANLGWCEDGREILDLLVSRFGIENCCILTSPCKTPGCEAGKVEWIKRHIPEFSRRFLIGAAKHFCAHSESLLVDDYFVNVEKFMAHGGRSVLVPRPWSGSPYHCDFKSSDFMTVNSLRLSLDLIGFSK